MDKVTHGKVLLISLVSAFVFSAVGASAAFAEPEFEFAQFPVSFTGISGAGRLETVGGNTVSCKGSTLSGEIKAAREILKGKRTFTGCTTKVGIFTAECKTKGAGAGEIVTNAVKGRPVFIKSDEPVEAGMLLAPESGSEFAKFECGTPPSAGDTITVTGETICEVPPTNATGENQYNVNRKSWETVCGQTKGKQNPEEYEEPPGIKHKAILECEGEGFKPFGREQCASEFTTILEAAAEGELKAPELPEFSPTSNTKFRTEEQHASQLRTAKGSTVACERVLTAGKFNNTPKKIEIEEVDLTGCASTSFGGSGKCQNTTTKGEIALGAFEGELVYVSKINKEAGVNLRAKGGTPGAAFAKFECETMAAPETVTVRSTKTVGGTGGIICGATPVNQRTAAVELKCTVQGGTQDPTNYENGKGKHFFSYPECEGAGRLVFALENCGLESELILAFPGQSEIRA